ncbi:hypothetical protein Tco_0843188 [Tanacetum coccineum]|uniref:Uncharacterized protein n=1 Tax=Tanacetum coccineum TaxID=301880 RepID=A0ABQ5B2A1_9ASTR
MMEEYNHQISFRADTLPIIKISYVVNSRKEATMKITRESKAKTLWVINHQEDRTSPPSELATLITIEERKIKRTEFIREMFVIEDVRVDGMNRNLIPPPRVVPIKGLVIKEPESGIFYMNRNTDVSFSKERDLEVMKGLSECETSKSNITRIQFKDIFKEVEDYLKTYSSAGMDISWYVEGIR